MNTAGAPRASDVEATLHERFLALVQAAPVGVIVADARGQIAAFNPAAAAILDVAAERAIGRTLIESVRNFELDRRIAAALRQGADSDGEIANVANERRLRVRVVPLPRADGLRDALAFIEDITELRDLAAIRRDFVQNVSHELRTPLTAVKIMVETLQGGVGSQAQASFLDSIARETNRMITLVEELLDLARLETGKLQLTLAPVDLGELLRKAGETQAARAASLGIELSVRAPDAPVTVLGDRDKLMQVVLNLLDNALRNTPSGGRVSAGVRVADGAAELVVDDSGVGIPADALPHVFERFYVVDPSRARNKSGTGLGLAIVKHMVESHGGTVRAESELNAGSMFVCRFPL